LSTLLSILSLCSAVAGVPKLAPSIPACCCSAIILLNSACNSFAKPFCFCISVPKNLVQSASKAFFSSFIFNRATLCCSKLSFNACSSVSSAVCCASKLSASFRFSKFCISSRLIFSPFCIASKIFLRSSNTFFWFAVSCIVLSASESASSASACFLCSSVVFSSIICLSLASSFSSLLISLLFSLSSSSLSCFLRSASSFVSSTNLSAKATSLSSSSSPRLLFISLIFSVALSLRSSILSFTFSIPSMYFSNESTPPSISSIISP
jgi:hypothetical protein